MRIRPGVNLIRITVGLATAGAAIFVHPAAIWAVGIGIAAAALMVVADYIFLRRQAGHVGVRRELPASVGRDMSFTSVLTVTHDGTKALVGRVRDVLPDDARPAYWTSEGTFRPGEPATFRLGVRIPARGRHRFGPVWVGIRGRFSALEAQRPVPCPGEVKVLPESLHTEEGLAKDAADELRLLDKISHTQRRGDGTEFESLSEFREGDDPRRIDWRSSARARRLIVRRFQVERHRDVMVLVDAGRLMGASCDRQPAAGRLPPPAGAAAAKSVPVAAPVARDAGAAAEGARPRRREDLNPQPQGGTKLDRAVDAALMLGRVALESGDRCGLGVFDDEVLGYLPPMAGMGSFRALVDSLYAVRSRWHESNFSLMFATLQARQFKRSLVVILSDLVDVDTTTRFRAAVASLARRHVVIFAALRTPQLSDLAAAPVETMLDGARKAVTFRIMRERERALHTLRSAGIHVLDVEPSRLTVPLVNQYIGLRAKNLL